MQRHEASYGRPGRVEGVQAARGYESPAARGQRTQERDDTDSCLGIDAAGGNWSGAAGDFGSARGAPRASVNSSMSDEDWEIVQKRDSLVMDSAEAAEGSGMGGLGLSGNVLARAGDWLQWGLDGAVKGVEKTCDGIKGVW
jgi:hypothetical protein